MVRAMSARLAPGDRVRVREEQKLGHVRTPDYVKGKPGVVAARLGEFRNPEDLAYGGDGLPEKPLYKIGFAQADLWSDYDGSPNDILYIDIYEHWLEHVGEDA